MKDAPPVSTEFILDMIRGFIYFTRRASCIVMSISFCLALPIVIAVVAILLMVLGVFSISDFNN